MSQQINPEIIKQILQYYWAPSLRESSLTQTSNEIELKSHVAHIPQHAIIKS